MFNTCLCSISQTSTLFYYWLAFAWQCTVSLRRFYLSHGFLQCLYWLHSVCWWWQCGNRGGEKAQILGIPSTSGSWNCTWHSVGGGRLIQEPAWSGGWWHQWTSVIWAIPHSWVQVSINEFVLICRGKDWKAVLVWESGFFVWFSFSSMVLFQWDGVDKAAIQPCPHLFSCPLKDSFPKAFLMAGFPGSKASIRVL